MLILNTRKDLEVVTAVTICAEYKIKYNVMMMYLLLYKESI
jgi:hypothetical protein